MTRPLGVLAIVLVVAAGCATRGSIRQIRDDLTALRTEVESLREAYEQHDRETTRTADHLRALGDRLSGLGTAVGDTGEAVRRLSERVAAIDARGREVRVEPTVRPPLASPPAPEPPRESPARAGAADAAYQAALATFRTREYGQAVLDFLDFLAKYPRHPLASHAQYWIGEAYYIQRDWHQALVEYEKVATLDGRSGSVPESLLKIGLCYQNLREPGRARQTWRRIIAEYPDSDAAQKARSLLRGEPRPNRR
jgi:tol-pal system protein YbgF